MLRLPNEDEGPGWGAAGLRGKRNSRRINCRPAAEHVKPRPSSGAHTAPGRRDVFATFRRGKERSVIKVANVG